MTTLERLLGHTPTAGLVVLTYPHRGHGTYAGAALHVEAHTEEDLGRWVSAMGGVAYSVVPMDADPYGEADRLGAGMQYHTHASWVHA